MSEPCYDCGGTGEYEFCLDCDQNVDSCSCEESSGSYTEDCWECDGEGEIEEEDE